MQKEPRIIPLRIPAGEFRASVVGVEFVQFLDSVFFNSEADRSDQHLISNQANSVPIHLSGDVILGQHELLQNMDSVVRYHELITTIAWIVRSQGSMHLVQVKNTVFHPTVMAVSQEIVLLVSVQRPGHQRFQQRFVVTVRQ